ncbi:MULTISPECIES: LysR family transcriptional regulator [unclassified Variovorax]|jgi:DNA-binding transcriptional LysR family regulator|uniref:LysR family transcriptional regulator n=1 Tax=unclassified Variovorax TaxID=663243 RepID=UPI0008C1DE70|nr:LysR family transcriptional regulator [Variovorax sp. OV084]SEU22089.1 transcriptional regulator, LysR family [Variovorax sp. OV084]
MTMIDISAVDLNILKVFEALYEEGGATRAGVRLGLTQSAVSAALARLRKTYGDQLFTRTGRGLVPTLRAQELKPLISEGLNKCRQSLSMSGSGGNDFHGRSIVVGLSDDFEVAFGRLFIDAVAARAPGLRLAFRQTHSLVVGNMLQARLADVAVVSGGLSSRLLGHEAIGQGRYACLMDPAYAPSTRGLTLPEYVRRGHLLVSSGGFIGVVDEVLAAIGRPRRVVASTTHFAALPHLLFGSDAIATIPKHAASAIAARTGLQMFACPLTMPRYAVEVGWRTDALRDAAIAEVRRVLLEVLQAAHWS